MSFVPEHLKYTKTHEWLEESPGEARIGITDHAQSLLGDLVFVELPEVGRVVSAGDELGVLESVKAASDYYAPVSGIVTAVNNDLVNNPALLNDDPYDKAWLVKLSISPPESLGTLLTAEQYSDMISKES